MKNLTPYNQFINEAEVPVEQNALEMVDKAMLGIKSMTEMIRKNPEYNGQTLQLSVPAI